MPRLFMMTEHSPFMMGFVLVTDGGRCIVVDGGREEDMPELLELIGGRKVAAWVLTHPHLDHITGFTFLAREGRLPDIERVYCAFPSVAYVRANEPQEAWTLEEFESAKPAFCHLLTRAEPGMKVRIDETELEFLFAGGEKYGPLRPNLAVNESSIVFRVSAEGARSILFLGDLGPAGGRDLLALHGARLKSDIVQMAHHGHSGVTREVYEAIAPEACLWCAPEWLWNEADIEWEPELFGTIHQRKWMDELGVKENYVSKDGPLEVPLKRK